MTTPPEPSAQARALAAALRRKRAFRSAVARYTAGLFDKQRVVLASTSRFVAVHAGRRSGKTHLGRVRVIQACADHPEAFIPIFERTSTCAAARVMWRDLKRDSARYGLGLEFNETLRIAVCPNRAQIGIVGIDKLDETEKQRGDAHPFVLIDEAGGFRPHVLSTLVRDVIRPALTDMRGSLWQIGTPNPTCSGPFHTACEQDKKYDVYHWDMRDNPHILDAAAEMAEVKREYGWGDEDPSFQREWLGLWRYAADNQVYCYDPARNHTDAIPDDLSRYVVGVDLGYIDSTAIVVLGFRPHDDRIWIVRSEKRAGLVPSDVAQLVSQYNREYGPDAIVADTGGLGRSLVEEMRQRYAIPVKAAEKREKLAYIELLNGDLRTGRLLVEPTENRELLTEWRLLQWESRTHKGGNDKPRISEACDDHLADATLYAWREATHWVPRRRKPEPITPDDPRYEDEIEKQMEDAYKRNQSVWADVDDELGRPGYDETYGGYDDGY